MTLRYVLDTNVLLRLQDVSALGALAALVDCEFLLTDIVWDEATRKPGVGTKARKDLSGMKHVVKHDFMPDTPVMERFVHLRKHYPESTYHDGELSVIALAAQEPDVIPVIFERRGHVAACDELRRPVLTGHWFFSELRQKHGLPENVLHDCVDLLNSKSYLTPTWYTPPAALPVAPAN